MIRTRAGKDGAEFVVVCGATHEPIGGPFLALREAVGFATAKAGNASARIVFESRDERGRLTSEPLVLGQTGPENTQ